MPDINNMVAGSGRVIKEDNTTANIGDLLESISSNLLSSGLMLQEQKNQDEAVDDVITFAENITAIEIFHQEATWQTFVVNGVTLTIPSGGYHTIIGGTIAKTVTIPTGVNCIVSRLA